MEFELEIRTCYTIRLADADLNKYWVSEPQEQDTSERADVLRDLRSESLDMIIEVIRFNTQIGNLKGVLTAYDDQFQDDTEALAQIQQGLKDPHAYWCVHYECDFDEEVR